MSWDLHGLGARERGRMSPCESWLSSTTGPHVPVHHVCQCMCYTRQLLQSRLVGCRTLWACAGAPVCRYMLAEGSASSKHMLLITDAPECLPEAVVACYAEVCFQHAFFDCSFYWPCLLQPALTVLALGHFALRCFHSEGVHCSAIFLNAILSISMSWAQQEDCYLLMVSLWSDIVQHNTYAIKGLCIAIGQGTVALGNINTPQQTMRM